MINNIKIKNLGHLGSSKNKDALLICLLSAYKEFKNSSSSFVSYNIYLNCVEIHENDSEN